MSWDLRTLGSVGSQKMLGISEGVAGLSNGYAVVSVDPKRQAAREGQGSSQSHRLVLVFEGLDRPQLIRTDHRRTAGLRPENLNTLAHKKLPSMTGIESAGTGSANLEGANNDQSQKRERSPCNRQMQQLVWKRDDIRHDVLSTRDTASVESMTLRAGRFYFGCFATEGH